MSDERKVNLSLRLGDNIFTLRADSVTEMEGLISEAEQNAVVAPFFLGPRTTQLTKVVPDDPGPDLTTPSDEEAVAAIKKELGAVAVAVPASKALIAVAARKSGKTPEELEGISEADAKRLITEGSK